MLDKRTNTILSYIVSNCETGSYTIYAVEDLIKCFPAKYKIDNVIINQIITYLKERNYLDIKHSDEKCYCISVLPKARIQYETDENLHKNDKKIKKFAIFLIILTFLFSFIGALSGTIIAKLFF